MTERLARLRGQVDAWIGHARALAWLGEAEVQAMQQLERRSPADLFNPAHSARPLVVAFFGGTGVGKSSLLNRLAGQHLARVGVQRPTSHEITVYVHEAVKLATLTDRFPVQQIHIERHADASRSDVLWVDMPDIDSVEKGNRELAFAWLPHVDLLIYVVSPERYRDEIGWGVLRQHGHRHGWMFVMNHWDEGALEQQADLISILHGAGFDDPLVLHTCCGGEPCPDDQFPELEASIRAVQAQHGQHELERLGHLAHFDDLAALLQTATQRLGNTADWQTVQAGFHQDWERMAAAVLDGMTWPIQEIAAEFAGRDTGLLTRLLGAPNASTGVTRQKPGATQPASRTGLEQHAAGTLWDPWAQGKLTEVSDTLEIALRRIGVSPQPLLARLQPVIDAAAQSVGQRLEESLRQGLARPGTAWQRALRRITGAALSLLPAAALLWVAYQVVTGFLLGATGEGAYLGADFAINSGLLVLVSWLLPYLLHRHLKPSMETTVTRALRTGLELGLEELKAQVDAALGATDAERAGLQAEAGRLLEELGQQREGSRPTSGPAVARLLSTQPRPAAAGPGATA
jgi:hypothetical protein